MLYQFTHNKGDAIRLIQFRVTEHFTYATSQMFRLLLTRRGHQPPNTLLTDFTEKYTTRKVLLNEVVGRNEIRVGLFCWRLQRVPTYAKHLGVGLDTESII